MKLDLLIPAGHLDDLLDRQVMSVNRKGHDDSSSKGK
jgi:hypothetical protein